MINVHIGNGRIDPTWCQYLQSAGEGIGDFMYLCGTCACSLTVKEASLEGIFCSMSLIDISVVPALEAKGSTSIQSNVIMARPNAFSSPAQIQSTFDVTFTFALFTVEERVITGSESLIDVGLSFLHIVSPRSRAKQRHVVSIKSVLFTSAYIE